MNIPGFLVGRSTPAPASLFRALGSRNFKSFFLAQGISLIGTWMQSLAVAWFAYRLTGSAFILGRIGFASQIPSLAISPIAGVLADRWNKRRLLWLTQFLLMIQALILAVLVLTHIATLWQLIVLSFFLGILNAVDMPTRQSFVVQMIDKKEDLGNAIALNSMLFNGARLVGPSIAGIVIGVWGEGICFLLNGVSYLPVLWIIRSMRVPARRSASRKNVKHEMAEGFRYVVCFPMIRSILMLIAMTSLFGTSFQVLMPVFAKEILHGGAHTLGFLMAATGVGALAGALMLASRRTPEGLHKIIPFAAGLFGAALCLVSRSRHIGLSLPLMAVAGLGMMMQLVSSNTLIQHLTDDDKRGRVMSLYTVAFMGMTPIGSLIAGSLASAVGAPNAVLASGIACLAGAMIFSRSMKIDS
jgi:MFS family permease